jgi:RNAse (barnase) inhibitor barstar
MPQAALESRIAMNEGGVWFVPTVDAKGIAALAKKAKFAFFHIDGRSVQRKEQLMNAMATALDLPEHFGHNWDALEECLADLDPVDAKGYVLLYDHIEGLLGAHPDQFETLVEILKDAVTSWKEDDTAMLVVLSGAKAPAGVERLKP